MALDELNVLNGLNKKLNFLSDIFDSDFRHDLAILSM